MKYLNYLSLENPLRPRFKPFDLWVGPAITATNDLFNRIEARDAAYRQRKHDRDMQERQIAFGREQMAAQRKMYDDSVVENRRLIAEERAYDTPAAMKARMRDAGINPYLAMSNGAAGSVAAGGTGAAMPVSNGQQSAPGIQGASTLPSPYYGTGLADAVMMYYQGLKTNSDIQSSNVDNMAKIAAMIRDNNKAHDEHKISDKTYETMDFQLKQAMSNADEVSRGLKVQNDYYEQQSVSLQLDDIHKEFQDWLSQQELELKKDFNDAEVQQLIALAYKSYTEASEMVKNGKESRLTSKQERIIQKQRQEEWISHGKYSKRRSSRLANEKLQQDINIEKPEEVSQSTISEALKNKGFRFETSVLTWLRDKLRIIRLGK